MRYDAILAARERYSPVGPTAVLLGTGLFLLGAGTVDRAVAEVEGPPQPTPQWRVSTTVNYSSGSYGADSRTNILYAPMTVRRVFRDGDLSRTIPVVSSAGTGAGRRGGGRPTAGPR